MKGASRDAGTRNFARPRMRMVKRVRADSRGRYDAAIAAARTIVDTMTCNVNDVA
jgi:hypothetical protein